MCVGNAGCSFHLLAGGVLHTESDVVEYRVVEENGFLVDIAYEAAQAVDAQLADVRSIHQNLSCAHIVVAGDKVHQGAFPASALPHQCHCLSFLNGEVHMA